MNAIAFLTLALPLSAPGPKDKPATDPLVGRWAATSMHFDGQPSNVWPGLEFEFLSDGRYVVRVDGKERPAAGPRTYTTDPKADPKAETSPIDFAEGVDTNPGLYKVKGDELTVSFRYEDVGTRPPDLRPRSGHMTITFKRVPKGK